ncbi:hypothetical protein BIU90_10095 [Curtobacterium sp. MCBA15_001]|nr:hypothetical protein BIU90_10095 [Curtobacterium sp. MCBA15_001]
MLVVATALAVQGCTATQGPKPLSGETAQEQMQSLVRDTMKTAGGEWTSASNGPAADPCSLQNGSEGVWFSWDQDADGPSDPEAVMHRVDQAWQDRGLTTTTQSVERTDGKTLHRVGSGGREVDSIEFNATTSRMSINVQSLCGTGSVPPA